MMLLINILAAWLAFNIALALAFYYKPLPSRREGFLINTWLRHHR